jgi:RecA-family ATPase
MAVAYTLRQIATAMGGEVSGKQVLCPGPSHSAQDRSLSIAPSNETELGVMFNSFAGDTFEACADHFRKKMGLPDFAPNGKGNGHAAAPQLPSDAVRKAANARKRAALAKHAAQAAGDGEKKIAAVYDYCDGSTLLYQVVRYSPKSFSQRRPDGNGGWITHGVFEGIRRIPYRWADLAKYPDGSVFVTEGERDADNVAALGLCSTCVAGGVWTADCAAPLADRDVFILEDNDKAGREKSLTAAAALHGVAKTIRIVAFTDMPAKGDVSDWISADPERHNADALAARCLAAPLWQPDTVLPPVADTPPEAAVENVDDPLPFLDMTTWDAAPAPPRLWAVRDRIPLRQPALFSGEGAIGKTLLALQLCAAHVLGRDWLGMLPEPGPAIYFGAEDDADEIHRRVADIAEHYRVSFADLVAGGLHLLSFAGRDAILGAVNRAGIIEPTPLFHRIHAAVCSIRPKTLVLDTSADVFAGNENDRMQVRQFVGLLRRLAIDGNCAVLLCSHPSLTGISSGTGLSGSTAWHNSVRARIFFRTAATDQGEEPDPELRELVFMKNNYGPLGASVLLRWKAGVFVPEPGDGTLERAAAEQKAEQAFCASVVQFADQGRNVSTKPNAPTYAPSEFAKEKEAHQAGLKKADLEAAMRRLLAAGKIRVESYGPPSRGWTRLVVV